MYLNKWKSANMVSRVRMAWKWNAVWDSNEIESFNCTDDFGM